ncbi:MAG: universal stress protein, partial [Haloferacaceae archaeon]|nr:universal stress protein [Haloferacaceae archaeon]
GYGALLEDEGFGVSMHAVRGTPHRRINGIAETVGASMIVVGSRGESPLHNRLIGSTARNLSRSTTVPLLVSRIQRERAHPDPTRAHLFRRTMFATDFSDNAAAAFSHFEYLRHATREATLVHVQTPRGEALDPAPEGVLTDLEEHAETLRGWGIDTTVDVRTGDPATELLAAEEAHDPTMTLLGSRGRSRLRRLLLGSVSERMLTEAMGNVLLVPPAGR